MANIEVKITNANQIKRAFAASPRLMKQNLATAMGKSAIKVKSTSSRNTPVVTGLLRGSTYARWSPFKAEIGTNTNYDYYVHWGTRFQRAQPYLLSAITSEAGFIEREFTVAADNTLAEIARKT